MHPVDLVLLRRHHVVFQPAYKADPKIDQERVTLAECALFDEGYLVDPALREVFSRLSARNLHDYVSEIVGGLQSLSGADRPHIPAFRGFPEATPHDTVALWWKRVAAWVLQADAGPCVLCYEEQTVQSVSPCGHLICKNCWDGSNYSNCPICHRRIDQDDPFVQPAIPSNVPPLPFDQLRILRLGLGQREWVARTFTSLAGREAAPSPQDLDDIQALGEYFIKDAGLFWQAVQNGVPSKMTAATVTAIAIGSPFISELVTSALWKTPTDVLRTMNILAGEDAGLINLPRRGATISRRARGLAMKGWEEMDLLSLCSEFGRREGIVKRLGELIHPFEYVDKYPKACAAFASARGIQLASLDPRTQQKIARVLAETKGVGIRNNRIHYTSFNSEVEKKLAEGELEEAIKMLSLHPGDLLRRADMLATRCYASDPMVMGQLDEALGLSVRAVSAPLLVSALGEVRCRARNLTRRLFFPNGAQARIWSTDETRPPLPAFITDRIAEHLTKELMRRSSIPVGQRTVVVESSLQSVPVPALARTASKSLYDIPRGTALPMPSGDQMRLFLHWMEDGGRVDLDLSVAFLNSKWEMLGECAYTQLRFHEDAAIHSGDLTSAPPPHGATEYVDLDFQRLRSLGVAYVLPVIFSYNNVAFEDMEEAFCGFMHRSATKGVRFDSAAVAQRLDLTGKTRCMSPFIADLSMNTIRSVDVHLNVGYEGVHATWNNDDKLRNLVRDLETYYTAGPRLSCYELAVMQAASRGQRILISTNDMFVEYHPRQGEDRHELLARILEGTDMDAKDVEIGDKPVWGLTLNGEIRLPEGSSVTAAIPSHRTSVPVSSFQDLLAQLAQR